MQVNRIYFSTVNCLPMVDTDKLHSLIQLMSPTWDKHPYVVFIKDRKGVYRYVNQSFLELTGFSKDEVIGHVGSDIFEDDPDQEDLFLEADRQVVTNGIIYDYQTTVVRKGNQFHSQTTKIPLYDSDHEIIGIYGESRDISSLVNAKIELKINLNLLETIMDTVPYPVFVKDTHFKYIRVNRAFTDEVGIPKHKLYGRTDTDIYGTLQAKLFEKKDEEVINTGKRSIYLTDQITNKAHSKKFMIVKDPLYDEKSEIIGIVGIIDPSVSISDIQEQLINQQKIEAISLMAGGIAHDLNNMLTSIMGITSILMEFELPTEVDQMIPVIHDATMRASTLIKKLLTFAKKNTDQKSSLNIIELINNVVNLLSRNTLTSISITANYEKEEILIQADITQITQLIMNLVMNAIEAIEGEGEIEISIKEKDLEDLESKHFILVPEEFKPGTYVNIEVSDNGKGISDTIINKIFDPFFTTKAEGTGLGLPVVYGVISAHKGLMDVSSKVGLGTTFSLYLPK